MDNISMINDHARVVGSTAMSYSVQINWYISTVYGQSFWLMTKEQRMINQIKNISSVPEANRQ
jgi:hypothetical protein